MIENKSQVRNLDLLAPKLAEIENLRVIEEAKGDKADPRKLQMYYLQINTLYHATSVTVQSKLQLDITDDSDKNNNRYVKKLDNKTAQGLQYGSAVANLTFTFLSIGLQFAGAGEMIKALSTPLQAFGSSLSTLGDLSDKATKAGIQVDQYDGQSLNNRRNEAQAAVQAARTAQAACTSKGDEDQRSAAAAFNVLLRG